MFALTILELENPISIAVCEPGNIFGVLIVFAAYKGPLTVSIPGTVKFVLTTIVEVFCNDVFA
jgi:hypothetical protein